MIVGAGVKACLEVQLEAVLQWGLMAFLQLKWSQQDFDAVLRPAECGVRAELWRVASGLVGMDLAHLEPVMDSGWHQGVAWLVVMVVL